MEKIYCQLDEAKIRILTISWLEILTPMMKKWGSKKQNKYFAYVYKTIVFEQNFDCEKINKKTLKAFEKDEEPEGSEYYGLDIFICVDSLVDMFGAKRDKAFLAFRENLLDLIDHLDEDLIMTKYSNEKTLMESVNQFINKELLEAEENKEITNEHYINSNLRKIFLGTFDTMIEILSNGRGEKELSKIKNLKNNIGEALSLIIEVVTKVNKWDVKIKKTKKPKRKIYNYLEGAEGTRLIGAVLENIRKEHYIAALRCLLVNRNGYGSELCIRYADNFSPKDYRYFGDEGVAFIRDPGCGSIYEVADIVIINEKDYYNILCMQKFKYKFTEAEEEQVDKLLIEIKPVLVNS